LRAYSCIYRDWLWDGVIAQVDRRISRSAIGGNEAWISNGMAKAGVCSPLIIRYTANGITSSNSIKVSPPYIKEEIRTFDLASTALAGAKRVRRLIVAILQTVDDACNTEM
jgi:hypothetical protein